MNWLRSARKLVWLSRNEKADLLVARSKIYAANGYMWEAVCLMQEAFMLRQALPKER